MRDLTNSLRSRVPNGSAKPSGKRPEFGSSFLKQSELASSDQMNHSLPALVSRMGVSRTEFANVSSGPGTIQDRMTAATSRRPSLANYERSCGCSQLWSRFLNFYSWSVATNLRMENRGIQNTALMSPNLITFSLWVEIRDSFVFGYQNYNRCRCFAQVAYWSVSDFQRHDHHQSNADLISDRL